MNYIDEINRIKEEQGYSYSFLAEKSGIEAGTLQKILTGQTKHPRRSTIEGLKSTYLSLSEPAMRYESIDRTKQPIYTVEDYLALPEDRRAELINGRMYDMAAPTVRHQMLVQEVWRAFSEYIRQGHGSCLPVISPVSVQLDRDDATMVEPDLIVVCDPDRFRATGGQYLQGAPDFIMEVLSPATRKRDMTIKLRKYQDAGVKEYWIVDPDQNVVIAYVFDDEVTPTIYSFSDLVPVAIYNGALEIDFPEITEWLKNYI